MLSCAVDAEFPKIGTARLLLQAAFDAGGSWGQRRVFLEVAADNMPARALYVGLGFDIVGRRPRYYRRPGGEAVDALIVSSRSLTGRSPPRLRKRRRWTPPPSPPLSASGTISSTLMAEALESARNVGERLGSAQKDVRGFPSGHTLHQQLGSDKGKRANLAGDIQNKLGCVFHGFIVSICHECGLLPL